MRISDAAAQTGLSIDTIRYYERTGLVPRVNRDSGGTRVFTPETIEWLRLLASLRDTGMAMKTMQRFAQAYAQGDATIPDRRAILLAHRNTLEERRTDLDRCADLLAYKLQRYSDIEGDKHAHSSDRSLG
ncbi:MAG: MerR family transcriptional regulator [Roseovarius sp.]